MQRSIKCQSSPQTEAEYSKSRVLTTIGNWTGNNKNQNIGNIQDRRSSLKRGSKITDILCDLKN